MNNIDKLVETIVEGIQEKKGRGIVVADMSNIDGAIAQRFVICEGNTPIQVEAIAESVGDMCRERLQEKPAHCVGLGMSTWVVLDFVDVVVHIFVPEARDFYDLEHLWEDAPMVEIPDQD